MKFILFTLLFSFSIYPSTHPIQDLESNSPAYITLGKDAYEIIRGQLNSYSFKSMQQSNDSVMILINQKEVPIISHMIHQRTKRCGGFIFHSNMKDAQKTLYPNIAKTYSLNAIFADYSIDQYEIVERLIPLVEERSIRSTIISLSKFKNRYYKSEHGVQSSNWLGKLWKSFFNGRNDVKVEYLKHSGWPQSSVVLTIKGSVRPDEYIVVGGHADSISGVLFPRGNSMIAPGADDNASGIAAITEAIRILANTGYRPSKTLQFIGYSAEEVGLRGSGEIASMYKRKNIKVRGVLQLDMTAFNKNSSHQISLISDYTNKEQNEFLGRLIDTYLPSVVWGYSKCGYACSDHASWYRNGFPASFPFEGHSRDANKAIHTKRDTLETIGGTANNVVKFAKLTLAYLVELDR